MKTASTASTAFPRSLRFDAPVVHLNTLDWLRAQRAEHCVYWSGRDGHEQMAGVDAAHVLAGDEGHLESAFTAMQRRLTPAHPRLRYYGGIAFDPAREPSAEWQPFGTYRFILPRFQLENRGPQSYLACNVFLRSATDCTEECERTLAGLDALKFPENAAPAALPVPERRQDQPDSAAWEPLIAHALEAIRRDSLAKVVLSRRSMFSFNVPLDPLALLMRMQARTPSSYAFCFRFGADAAFLGATPERLYRRQGRRVASEAIASTRPRGATDAEDAALARDLLACDKDRREHAFVVRAIEEVFERLCRSVDGARDISVLKLPTCQHLFCPLEGLLNDGVSDAALVQALHPSPAVGGVPTDRAVAYIREHEPFDRGWYAGPVGWIGPESSEFAVAIRSGLVRGDTLSLYSGAGIVAGSTPDGEWDEVETKLSNALSALTGNHD
jgi:menaquinone-specific isochorismate synthase